MFANHQRAEVEAPIVAVAAAVPPRLECVHPKRLLEYQYDDSP
jgi:hypothetical protein